MESKSRRNAFEDAIRLDSEGNWYQGDFPILHERTCQFFYKHIARNAEGKYYLQGEERPVYIKVEDIPYWVTKVERTIAGYLITLTDESIELLDLNFLWIGKKNALYCGVKRGKFPAKFMRVPYYEITKDLQQRGKKYFLVFRGKSHPIKTAPPKHLSSGGSRPKHARSFKKAAKKKKRR